MVVRRTGMINYGDVTESRARAWRTLRLLWKHSLRNRRIHGLFPHSTEQSKKNLLYIVVGKLLEGKIDANRAAAVQRSKELLLGWHCNHDKACKSMPELYV